MATLYFNADQDYSWGTLGNWWQNPECTTPALALPLPADSIVVTNAPLILDANRTVAHATINSSLGGSSFALTVTGTCVFNGSSITFGTVFGTCIINQNASIEGTLIGPCTFNDASACLFGGIQGDCIFNNTSRVQSGYITGNCRFNDLSINSGTIVGSCTFNDGSSNYQTVNGYVTFNDGSCNDGGYVSAATFNATSFNGPYGVVDGDAIFTSSASAAASLKRSIIYGPVTLPFADLLGAGL